MSKNCINKRENMISLEEYCNKIISIYEDTISENKSTGDKK